MVLFPVFWALCSLLLSFFLGLGPGVAFLSLFFFFSREVGSFLN